MNISLQIGRGFVALALCVALGAFAATHPVTASAATLSTPKTSLSVSAVHVAKARLAHDKKQRCEVAMPTIVIGAPVAITIDGAPLATAGR